MDHVRVSDDERERVAAFLRDRCLEGCLDPEELDERVAAALRARTRGSLGDLVADLPGGAATLPGAEAVAVPPAGAPPARRSRVVPVLAVLAALAVALPLVVPEELLLVAAVAAAGLVVLAMILVVSLAPWVAAGAGAVWAVRRLKDRAAPPAGPGLPPQT